MPTYRMMCVLCGEFEMWQSIHDPLPETHSCGNTVAQILQPPALHGIGSRGARTREVDAKERDWSKDMAAYNRFRNKGHQPLQIDGCDKLEATAVGDWHVKTNQPHTDERVNNAAELARAIVAGEA